MRRFGRRRRGREQEKLGPAEILYLAGRHATEADLPHAGDLMSIIMGRYSPRDPVLLAEGVAKRPPLASETVAVDAVARAIWKAIARGEDQSLDEALMCGVPYVLRFRRYLESTGQLPPEEEDG